MHYHRVFENIVCISKKFTQEGFDENKLQLTSFNLEIQ